MHSETELPRSGSEWSVHSGLWGISEKYKPRFLEWARRYYPWGEEDLQMVVVTLGLFIGRYRKQGHVALRGPCLMWGKYMQAEKHEGV